MAYYFISSQVHYAQLKFINLVYTSILKLILKFEYILIPFNKKSYNKIFFIFYGRIKCIVMTNVPQVGAFSKFVSIVKERQLRFLLIYKFIKNLLRLFCPYT